ncbi:D-tyrosyl-tRNA(Tyr) deacylase [Moraxella atlantae]|uniref:D-aminoacyl-tRNA deacylase n=1 Tax=Faucicola atlantae TaxID=34059 RepID=A0A1B8QE82_9GAMM|nr:D-aminoacyl-tRNA deacylase [Moraxella atlantae]OBX79987.1 D-tyrosyl-tRNA(Tyr) deacylase [Moraxella atlantae]
MKAVIQRVRHAKVEVNQQTVGQIEHGVLVYLGLAHGDTLAVGQKMVDKILNYRLFANAQDKLDYSLQDVGGGLLIVSQFTLLADTRSGRRPDFGGAMTPSDARDLFAHIVRYAHSQYANVATGEFGADMQVTSCNDGPINFIFELVAERV